MSTIDNQDREQIERYVQQALAKVEAKLDAVALDAGLFSATLGLLAAVTDPVRAKAHIDTLHRLSAEIKEARRQLEIKRIEQAEAHAAKDTEQAARENRIRSDEINVALKNQAVPAINPLTKRPSPPSRTVPAGPHGMTQTIYEDRDAADPHYGRNQ